MNTKEVWRDRDLQIALRYKNSLSRLLTDKFALEVSESPSHFHIELSKPLLILGQPTTHPDALAGLKHR